MNETLLRKVSGFNPYNYLEKGKTLAEVKPNGEVIPEKEVFYLPAWARQAWFNAYCQEQGKIMPLTSKILKDENGKVVFVATLSEIFEGNDGNKTVIPVATGYASAFVGQNDCSTIERCETCAKGRCLGAAGFILTEEKSSMFDEGDIPIDGALINRKSATTSAENNEATPTQTAPKETQPKKKRGRPRKNPGKNPDSTKKEADTQENFFKIPEIPKLPVQNEAPEESTSKKNANIESEEESLLTQCLDAFFPYGPYRGQQVFDIITMPKFKQYLDEVSHRSFGNIKVDDKLSVDVLIRTLKKYLDSPSAEERALLLKVMKNFGDNE